MAISAEVTYAAGPGASVPIHAAPDLIAFDIESRALPAALDAYSAVSGISVLCDGALARGRVSASVRGLLTAPAALAALLTNTGLAATFTREHDAIIVLSGSAPTLIYGDGAAPAGPVVPLGAIHVDTPVREPVLLGSSGLYASLVQFELERALRHNSQIRARPFEAQVRIWVDTSGVVQRSELVSSTARGAIGQEIVEVFDNLTISQPPPADLLQPVSIRVAVSAP